MFGGMFFCGILIGGVVAVLALFVFNKTIDIKKKIKCDRVPYGIIDETLKGDDKINAIQANLDTIIDGNLTKGFTFGHTHQIELQAQTDLFVFMDKNKSAVGIEDKLSFMYPFKPEKVTKWTLGTIFIMRPGNCDDGLDTKYTGKTVSFEAVQSPRSYLGMTENSTELGLVKVDVGEGDHTCSAWSTCFIMSQSDTGNTQIGSVEYPG